MIPRTNKGPKLPIDGQPLIYSQLSALLEQYQELSRSLSVRSLEELADLLFKTYVDLACCMPVAPPSEFTSRVKKIIRADKWQSLLISVQQWSRLTGDQATDVLSGKSLETLAVGLLWQTVLISEYQRRLQSIDVH